MTIGERIQKKRKEAGMSQEELGAKLKVSRQSVYKWENGQSLPELNNLIAMAELFHVRVGWLICEESDSQDDHLRETLRDILDAKSKQKGRRRIVYICGITPVVLAGWFLLSRINSLENRYLELQQTIAIQTQQVRDEVSSITYRVQNALETYSSLTVSSDVTIDHYDYEHNTVTILLSAQPKSFTDETEAVFHIRGNQVYSFQAVRNELLYTAEAEIPLSDETLEVSVEFIQDGESQTALLDILDDLISRTFPYADMEIQAIAYDGYGYGTEYDINVSCEYSDDLQIPEITEIRAYIYDGDERIAEIPINREKTDRINRPYSTKYERTIFSVTEEYSSRQFENHAVHVELQDSYGRIMTLINDNSGTHYQYS
ncbi:MAG: helix-turn-helix domain-containing protein [Bulleidia sp.]